MEGYKNGRRQFLLEYFYFYVGYSPHGILLKSVKMINKSNKVLVIFRLQGSLKTTKILSSDFPPPIFYL